MFIHLAKIWKFCDVYASGPMSFESITSIILLYEIEF